MKYKIGTKLKYVGKNKNSTYFKKGKIYTVDGNVGKFSPEDYSFKEFRGRTLHGGWMPIFVENIKNFKLLKIKNWREKINETKI